MGKLEVIARWILALILLFFGSNAFHNFLPAPEMSGKIATFTEGMMVTGYFFPFLGIVMVLVGLSIIFNKWVSLALIILAPVSINIILYHLFLDLATILP